MLSLRRRGRLVSVVVPVYRVEPYLADCLDSILASRHRELEVVVVDDGSPDRSGEIAEQYAARDRRVRVLHQENAGLGAARNAGLREGRGDLVAFADSDDRVPSTAYAELVAVQQRHGVDVVTGGVQTLHDDGELRPLRWLDRLHEGGPVLEVAARPRLLGDVFAWNKLSRRDLWERTGIGYPEGVRYEDQPATTALLLAAGRVGVVTEPVYHWRIREDGSSITQQRTSVADLVDRWATKQQTLATVEAHGDEAFTEEFRTQVLAGDMWRYFELIPEAGDDWWSLLVDGVRRLWGAEGLLDSDLPPVHRVVGWLVAADRRGEADAVVRHRLAVSGPLPRVAGPDGDVRLDLPVLDDGAVPAHVLRLRAGER